MKPKTVESIADEMGLSDLEAETRAGLRNCLDQELIGFMTRLGAILDQGKNDDVPTRKGLAAQLRAAYRRKNMHLARNLVEVIRKVGHLLIEVEQELDRRERANRNLVALAEKQAPIEA